MKLTRDEIMKLEGRELDAAIAEHIFGWKWDKDEETGDPVLLGPKFNWGGYAAVPAYWPTREPKGIIMPRDKFYLPYFSTDIVDAWEIVKVFEHNWNLLHGIDGKYRLILSAPGMPMAGVEADTAPLAICRAALLTLESAP